MSWRKKITGKQLEKQRQMRIREEEKNAKRRAPSGAMSAAPLREPKRTLPVLTGGGLAVDDDKDMNVDLSNGVFSFDFCSLSQF